MAPRFRLDSPTHPEQVEFLRAELDRRGWTETRDDDWQFCWSFDLHDEGTFRRLGPDQKINHFPGVGVLAYKDEFSRYVRTACSTAGIDHVVPETYHLGRQLDEWRAHATERPETIWIVKPTNLTGGRGMFLLTDPDDLDAAEHRTGWIVQRYISDPFLLPDDPFKHTTRVYTLITSLDPLTVFVHPNGPVKFTGRPFGTSPDELTDLVRHLTNPSVQLTNTDAAEPVRTSDWHDYAHRLADAGIVADEMRRSLNQAVARAVAACHEPLLRVSGYRCDRLESCYELLGFDVTFDAALRPWLLECNASPSLSLRGNPGSPSQLAQERSKRPMIADTLTLLGINDVGEPAGADFADGVGRRAGSWQRLELPEID